MSVFNLNIQNESTGNKIVAGLERLSHVFKTLLWEKAKEYGLSPVQIQIMIFVHYHSPEKNTVSYLAKEFSITKPTVSDAVKILEQKKLLQKINDAADSRSFYLHLTDSGKKIVHETEDFTNPISHLLSGISGAEQELLWGTISGIIVKLNRQGVIKVQRACKNCRHFSIDDNTYFCGLLKQPLAIADLRIDCHEFSEAV
ncbi:winged helix-turn-helix transcriptional regulator [Flavobacterium zepuense]|uniref:Winged helix-turn-helix transcriptional regulator n=1 Tax=Flavobacterium zepuense TaxID=2593302 RepID=A0A552UX84_9FLAO|nr:MarR family winged helix-turn-helix transcriptional regulator [Flavobacterium zepuense]TRW22819.1 winged helix-turn-helix transcriptional regulator [Flavobacterium zepuense]